MLRGGWILRKTATRQQFHSQSSSVNKGTALIRFRAHNIPASLSLLKNNSQTNVSRIRIRQPDRRFLSMSVLPPTNNNNSNNNDGAKKVSPPSTILPSNNNNESGRKGRRRNAKDTEPRNPRNKTRPSRSIKKNSSAGDKGPGDKGQGTATTSTSASSSSSTPPTTSGNSKAAKRYRRRVRQRQSQGTEKNTMNSNTTTTCDNVQTSLQEWYEENHGVKFSDKCITLKHITHKNLWKAQFKCPMTGEIFHCGTLLLSGTVVVETVEDDSGYRDVAYLKQSDARRAALARGLDCFRYRRDPNAFIDDIKFCEEVPYEFGADLSAIVAAAAAAQEELMLEEMETSDEDEVEDVRTSEISQSGDELDDDEEDSDEDLYGDEDSDDEEYTITYLPGTAPGGNTQQTFANPMERVIGGWSDTTMALQSEMEFVPVIMDKQPEKELAKLIRNAQDWMDQEQPSQVESRTSQHRVILKTASFSRTLDIANSILKGLGNAHSRLPCQETERGVEEVATKIVNYLWTTMSAQPNADTYGAFLACLEGPNPESVDARAKDVLEKMKTGAPIDTSVADASTYPAPTIKVFNAVVQRCAQLGGESGRFSLREIENPNRETFLSILSCMSYQPVIVGEAGGFDPIFAQDCIDGMKALADKDPADESLTPDLQVYNAGLRWSGGVQSAISRPHARPIPWDLHALIFREGFQEFDEECGAVQEAYRMHAWLEEMAGLGGAITPNIETYEAVIQAYIRTGTQEGVQQTEILLNSLLSSPAYNHTLRMQTFHPIIAAWAYSGHEEGPAKVNRWISRLELLSNDEECNFKIDSRVREAPLLAHASRMTTLLENQQVMSVHETEQLLDTAHGCTVHLKDLCTRLQAESADTKSSNLLDAQMFVQVLHNWGKLGTHFLETNDESGRAELALGKMYETVEEYEGLVLSLHKKRQMDSHEKMQLQHMTGSAHKVYGAFLATLKDAFYLHKSSDSAWALNGHISSIERWVRRTDEFKRINSSSANEREYPDDILYSDMYSYNCSGSLTQGSSELPADFLAQVVEYLKDDISHSLPPQRRGDIMRLCFLTMDLMSTQSDQSPLTSAFKDVVDTVCNLSSGPEEQEALLARVLSQVDSMNESGVVDVDPEAIAAEIRKHSSIPRYPSAAISRRRKFRRGQSRSRSPGSRSRKRNGDTKKFSPKKETMMQGK